MTLKYILKIFIDIIFILSIVLFINSIRLKLHDILFQKILNKTSTTEGLENNIPMNGSKAFCDTHSGFDLEQSCNSLTNYNCNLTSCCVWTSDQKCKSGNAGGPTFNSDTKGKSLPLDYYYFQNKCYGSNCP
jgi:hypothetical protein